MEIPEEKHLTLVQLPKHPCLLPGYTLQWLSNLLRTKFKLLRPEYKALSGLLLALFFCHSCSYPTQQAPVEETFSQCSWNLGAWSETHSSFFHLGNPTLMPRSTRQVRFLPIFPKILYQFLLHVWHITLVWSWVFPCSYIFDICP